MAAFVIVCGPPASGKSRIASLLSRELRLPVISKDLIKERLMDHLGGGAPVGEAAFATQFAIARELLTSGTPFILEGAFFRDQAPLIELGSLGHAIVVEVVADLETLERRYSQRELAGVRHPGHRGLEALPDLRRRVAGGEYRVPDLGGPTLRVDTTREGSRPGELDVAEWVRKNLEPRAPEQEQADTPGVLRIAWDEQAAAWTRWARTPGHDTYWRFGRAAFFSMLPPPGRLTLDLGCGEGRVSRDLVAAGHQVLALDGSPGLARAAHEAAPAIPVLVADGARLPVADGACDLVVAYMTLHDFDQMESALREAFRVLSPGGRLAMGVVHPINSAGEFASMDADAPFVIKRSYFEPRSYVDHIERDGLAMTFSSRHHTLEEYSSSITEAGFTLDAVREVTSPEGRWDRLPMFLFMRAVKP